MNYGRKLLKGSIIVFILNLTAAFIGYLIRIIWARKLTPEEYGLVLAVLTLVTFIKFLKSFGIPSALIKYIPEFQVKGQNRDISAGITGTFIITFSSSIVYALILILFSGLLAQKYFHNALAKPLLIVFAIAIIVSTFKELLRSLFAAFQRMVPYSLIYLVENLMVLLLFWIIYSLGFGILAVSWSYVIAFCLSFLIFIPFFFRIFPATQLRLSYRPKLVAKLFRYGILVILMGVGSTIFMYTDTLILTYFRSLTEVGIYNVVVPTAMLLNFFGTSIVAVLFPMSSEIWALNLKDHLLNLVYTIQKYTLMVILPIALIIFAFPSLIIKILFGGAYISGAVSLQILIIGLVFFVLAQINISILSGIGYPKASAKLMMGGALLNFGTNLYFIPKWGIVGAASTSLISYMFVYFMSLVYVNRHVALKIPVSFFKIIPAGFLFIISIMALKRIITDNVFIEAGLCISIALVLYLVLLFWLKVFSPKEIFTLLKKES